MAGDFAYHTGELAVQRRAGEAERASAGGRTVRTTIPEIAREFLAAQRLVVVASTDPEGHRWCSALSGPAGFTRALDERTVVIDVALTPGDPLGRALASGQAPLGMLAVEPQTRRRMRFNGAAELRDGRIYLRTSEVYANCRKYIQTREISAREPAATRLERRAAAATTLSTAQRGLVAVADTFFVATAGPDGLPDASHRGGNPGFLQVLDERTLAWPDYAGNAMYMTLGNLELSAAAGLLFLDWEAGAALQLSGRAAVDWDPERAAQLAGAERVVDFRVERVVEAPLAHPMHWELRELSRFNPPLT